MPRDKHGSCRNSRRGTILGHRVVVNRSAPLRARRVTQVMSRRGFTLIELLIVVVVIGLLASIAIPKFANTKEKAYVGAMKSDLRNLATAEEAYFYDSAKYTTNFALMNNFRPSTGVTLVVTQATPSGCGVRVSRPYTGRRLPRRLLVHRPPSAPPSHAHHSRPQSRPTSASRRTDRTGAGPATPRQPRPTQSNTQRPHRGLPSTH